MKMMIRNLNVNVEVFKWDPMLLKPEVEALSVSSGGLFMINVNYHQTPTSELCAEKTLVHLLHKCHHQQLDNLHTTKQYLDPDKPIISLDLHLLVENVDEVSSDDGSCNDDIKIREHI
ncbi:OLC1v1035424C1 [Oldenlandia corymbosa var. corymbosa]|uniref:OLC1v1035424C1 n=1 Tax=Oldenlandia corymbosa var. corymbosa TaxID=529605 RepID=A0AAV1CUT6_OLDCO|nr:OLC1v1035424C1 [Oldenlandia corymbosa var. corymbosa]